MANNVSVQILVDGRENTVVKMQGVLDSSDVVSTVLVDPALLSDLGPFAGLKASNLRIKRIQYSIEDSLSVNLQWDATTPLMIEELVGRGQMDYGKFGGLQNNAGTGKTGKITFSTQGWATGSVLSFSLILELGKQ